MLMQILYAATIDEYDEKVVLNGVKEALDCYSYEPINNVIYPRNYKITVTVEEIK